MTFDEFVAEWRKQVHEYGNGVPQEAIDMSEQAWEIATTSEREACAVWLDNYDGLGKRRAEAIRNGDHMTTNAGIHRAAEGRPVE